VRAGCSASGKRNFGNTIEPAGEPKSGSAASLRREFLEWSGMALEKESPTLEEIRRVCKPVGFSERQRDPIFCQGRALSFSFGANSAELFTRSVNRS
jgi:hypothetical protein